MSNDKGGPRREYLQHLCNELESASGIFAESLNERESAGESRENRMLRAGSESRDEWDCLYSLGALMGFSLLIGDCVEVNLCKHLFQFLKGKPLLWSDLRQFNANLVHSMERLGRASAKEVDELEMNWLTTLSDGIEKELVTGGADRLLTQRDLPEFLLRTQQMHLSILERQLSMIRMGFLSTIPAAYLYHTTGEQLELELCGLQHVPLINCRSTWRL